MDRYGKDRRVKRNETISVLEARDRETKACVSCTDLGCAGGEKARIWIWETKN